VGRIGSGWVQGRHAGLEFRLVIPVPQAPSAIDGRVYSNPRPQVAGPRPRGRPPSCARPERGASMKRLLPKKLVSALRRSAATDYELPDEVVRASRNRVRVAALLGAAAYTLLLALEMSGAVPASALEHRIDVTHDIAGAA